MNNIKKPIDIVKEMLNKKKSNSNNTELDLEKIKAIDQFLIDYRAFVKVDRLTGISILEFLGASEDEAYSLYEQLTLYDNIKGDFILQEEGEKER